MKISARIFVFALVFAFALIPLLPLSLLFSSTSLNPLALPKYGPFGPFLRKPVFAASPVGVVINEVAWMGTEASTADEWIELYNNTGSEVDLSGWTLKADDGIPDMDLTGTIAADEFYLLERSKDDNSVSDISADQTYTNALGNDGEYLKLRDSAGVVVDEVDCSVGWFAGKNTPKTTMERIDPEASGSAQLNWDNNDGVTVNGFDANAQPIWGTPKKKNSVYGKPKDEEEPDEELEIIFTLPSEATAGEGFDVPVTVKNADPGSGYYAKVIIGESTESASLRKGYTYNPALDKWLAWNGSWSKMPTFTTNSDASFTLKSKVKDDAESGTYHYLVRIRKVGTDDNLDSNAQTFNIVASSNSSTSSGLEITFSVDDADLKVNQSFDVKIEIKNAEPRRDYYVKTRLGLEESKLTKGRTYSSFYDTWLWDGKAWKGFPIIYTDSEGGWEGSIEAKVNTGNPADTYYMEVRIRDKETEKNYDSETQELGFSEEDPEVAKDPPLADGEGAVLGAMTELPATGGGGWLPVLGWMILIFLGSSTTGASVSSNRTVDFLAHKLVHLFEYSVLFLLIHRAVKRSFSFILNSYFFILSFVLTIGYAATDEIHQSLVPGRDARLTDVLIDASAALLAWFVLKLKQSKTSTYLDATAYKRVEVEKVLIFLISVSLLFFTSTPVLSSSHLSFSVPDGYELKEGEIDHLGGVLEIFGTCAAAISFKPDFNFDLAGFATFVYSYEKYYGNLDPSVFTLTIYEGAMEHCDLDAPLVTRVKPLQSIVDGESGEAPTYQLFFGFDPIEVKAGQDYTAILTTTETTIGRYRFWYRGQYFDGFFLTFNPVTQEFSRPSSAQLGAPFGLFVQEGWQGTPPRFHPVVLIHGMGGVPSDWQHPEQDYVALVQEMYAADEDFEYSANWIHLYHFGYDDNWGYNYQGDIRDIALGLESVVEDLATRYAESFGETLESLEERDEDRVVDVVGYSMGGLVARQYLIKHQDNHHVRRLVTIATPHQGVYWLARKQGVGTFSRFGPRLEGAISDVWDSAMMLWDKSGQPISLESTAAKQMIPGSEFYDFLNLVEWTPLDVQYYTIYGDIDINFKEKIFFFTMEKKVALGDVVIFSESAVGIPAVEPKQFGYNEEWTFPIGVAVTPEGVSAKFYIEGLDLRKFKFWHLNILHQPEIKDKTIDILSDEI